MNLNEEIRSDYKVSAKMKRIWAIEMEILGEFINVCSKYGLEYRIMAGTLLGAVRHKGFIPWDNDIDVAMSRNDFNRLLEVGSEAFKDPFFFQTPVTENARFFNTFVRIRHSLSTGATKGLYELGINCGIFIDVFCLDELPNNKVIRKLYTGWLNEIAKMKRLSLGEPRRVGFVPRMKDFLRKIVYRVIYKSPNAAELFDIFHHFAASYEGKDCREIATLACGYNEFDVWDKSLWDQYVMLDFEDMKLKAPAGYDAVLRIRYGNYMIPPEDKTTHVYIDFNPDVPYKQFYESIGNLT